MIDTLTKTEQMLIDRFILLIIREIVVESIYLFGSRAKAKGHLWSDIDLAIVVRDKEHIKETTQKAIELSIKAEEELDIIGELMLSPIVINKSLLNADIGIGKTIREEGILLWSRESTGQKLKVM
jgi:predicted nucleotidyltransferase